MKFFDRLLTIVITATLTSVFWIVFGGTLFDLASEQQARETDVAETTPAATASDPVSAPPPAAQTSPVVQQQAVTPTSDAPSSQGTGTPAAIPQLPPAPAPTAQPSAAPIGTDGTTSD